ncbi:MAG TPA: glycosyltransferase [Tepidisphaeraceae bacterium]|jgi:hypothetical protein|nr:glycosyltransferase [Tepidisphaeraceae bacterium]
MLRKLRKRVPILERMNAAWQARRQEKRARIGLAHYQLEARKLGITCPAGAELKAAVSARLAATGRAGIKAKPKGGLHLFLPYGVENWERVLPRSLAPFGEVSEFEWRSRGFNDSGSPATWVKVREEMNREMWRAFEAAHANRPVDVVCAYVSGYTVGPEILRKMAGAGAVILNFCYDDKVTFPGPLFGGRYASPASIADAVDLNLTCAPACVVKYAVHGGLGMFWPEAAHPEVHRPYDVPFEFDAVLPGSGYGWRPRFVAELRKLGIDARGFGKGWPSGPLSDEELVRLYSRSRIVLGSGGIGHSRKLMCLKGRDFEVPMAGGLYLTSNNPELSLCFDVGKEILTYTDAADCARTIRRLLDHPEEAAQIRQAGRERSLRDHTYEARWGEAFRMVGLLD